jgi:hypothetical protein
MNELSWTECVLIGATAGVDPTVVRRMGRGLGVRRSSRKVIEDAAEKLGLSSKFQPPPTAAAPTAEGGSR